MHPMRVSRLPARATKRYLEGMAQVLVMVGQSDPHSLTRSLAGEYAHAAAADGAEVTCIDLTTLAFDPVLRGGYRGGQTLEPDLAHARDALLAAQHVAWFFPMWWSGPPAIVKAFVDRLFTPGFAFRYRGRFETPERLLRGRSARLVVSMDSSAPYYTWVTGRPLHKSFARGTLAFVGFTPVRTNTFYEARFMREPQRAKAAREITRAARTDVQALTPSVRIPSASPLVLTDGR